MRVFALVVAGVLVQAVMGCGNACDDLRTKICNCETNSTNQQTCLARAADDTHKVTNAEQTRCAQLNDTCTCGALACGNLAACGLTNDAGIDLGTKACN